MWLAHSDNKEGATWLEAVPEAAEPDLEIQKQDKKTNSEVVNVLEANEGSYIETTRDIVNPAQSRLQMLLSGGAIMVATMLASHECAVQA